MRAALGFFALMYAISWTCFAGRVRDGARPGFGRRRNKPAAVSVGLFGTFAPSIVALGLTARSEGAAGIQSLLERLFKWRVGVRWYVFAAGYLATIKIGVALVHRIAIGVWPRFGVEPWYILAIATVLRRRYKPARRSAGAVLRSRSWRPALVLRAQVFCSASSGPFGISRCSSFLASTTTVSRS